MFKFLAKTAEKYAKATNTSCFLVVIFHQPKMPASMISRILYQEYNLKVISIHKAAINSCFFSLYKKQRTRYIPSSYIYISNNKFQAVERIKCLFYL